MSCFSSAVQHSIVSGALQPYLPSPHRARDLLPPPRRQELTPCLVQSSVTLSVPMDAPVTFATELVRVSWSLRFEFVMAPPESRWNLGGEWPSSVPGSVFSCLLGGQPRPDPRRPPLKPWVDRFL